MPRPLTSVVRAVATALAFSVVVPVNAQPPASPVLTEMPKPNGTPVPRTSDGRADLSGVWNKAIHQNTSRPVEPLPFTPAGLKAFNEVAQTHRSDEPLHPSGRTSREQLALSVSDHAAVRTG